MAEESLRPARFSAEIPGLQLTDPLAAQLLRWLERSRPGQRWELEGETTARLVARRPVLAAGYLGGTVEDQHRQRILGWIQEALRAVDSEGRIDPDNITVTFLPVDVAPGAGNRWRLLVSGRNVVLPSPESLHTCLSRHTGGEARVLDPHGFTVQTPTFYEVSIPSNLSDEMLKQIADDCMKELGVTGNYTLTLKPAS